MKNILIILASILILFSSHAFADGNCKEVRSGYDCTETTCTNRIRPSEKIGCSNSNVGQIVTGTTNYTCTGTCEYMNCSRNQLTQTIPTFRKKQIKTYRCAQVISNGSQSFAWKQDCFTIEIKKCKCKYERHNCKGDSCAPNGFTIDKAVEPNCTYEISSTPSNCGGSGRTAQSSVNTNPATYAVDPDISLNNMASIISEISSPLVPESMQGQVCVIEVPMTAEASAAEAEATKEGNY